MKTCLYCKIFYDYLGYNIEISVNVSRWLVGFGWVWDSCNGNCIHINIGPVAVTFYKQLRLWNL